MRQLWPPTVAMEAPWRSTAAGRPLVAYSFAINYAISGMEVWSYHLFNLCVHVLNVLLLYGVLRFLEAKAAVFLRGTGWALAVSLLWALHPLNTETVVYIAQRTELMMASFMLASLWCLAKTGEAVREGQEGQDVQERNKVWMWAALGLGVLGTLCKESAVVLPVLWLLFDRAFVSGSFAQAWRRHKMLYVGSILLVAVAGVIVAGDHRGGLITDDASITWRYLLTQGGVIVHYLWLSVWPAPLVLTYDWPLVSGLGEAWPTAGAVFLLLMAGFYAVFRWPALGFVAAWFFLILAPTSSVIPIMTEVVGERRMYLPLISVLGLILAGVWWLTRGRDSKKENQVRRFRYMGVVSRERCCCCGDGAFKCRVIKTQRTFGNTH